MNEFLVLPLVGAIVSVVVQLIKVNVGTYGMRTIALAAALSVVAGGIYFLLAGTVFWQDALKILVYANAVYGFVIKQLE